MMVIVQQCAVMFYRKERRVLMRVVVGAHSQTAIGNGRWHPYIWTSKTFSLAINNRGFITIGMPFTTKHVKELLVCKRFTDSHLSSLLLRELARVSLDKQDFTDVPIRVFTDTGYEVKAVFLEWSEEASVYLLYSLVEGKINAVKVEGSRVQIHGKGRIDTRLLFCVPFYCFTGSQELIHVDTPNVHIKALCELINGNCRNHTYLHANPEVYFSYVTQERATRELIGNKSLMVELKWLQWSGYVK